MRARSERGPSFLSPSLSGVGRATPSTSPLLSLHSPPVKGTSTRPTLKHKRGMTYIELEDTKHFPTHFSMERWGISAERRFLRVPGTHPRPVGSSAAGWRTPGSWNPGRSGGVSGPGGTFFSLFPSSTADDSFLSFLLSLPTARPSSPYRPGPPFCPRCLSLFFPFGPSSERARGRLAPLAGERGGEGERKADRLGRPWRASLKLILDCGTSFAALCSMNPFTNLPIAPLSLPHRRRRHPKKFERLILPPSRRNKKRRRRKN